VDWNELPGRVAADATLVKNTTQRVVAKALDAMESYHEYDDFGLPSHTKDGVYLLRANYEEGYTLTLRDDDTMEFRISAKPYKHVEGVLQGDDAHLDVLRAALAGGEWNIGTAEALFHDGHLDFRRNETYHVSNHLTPRQFTSRYFLKTRLLSGPLMRRG